MSEGLANPGVHEVEKGVLACCLIDAGYCVPKLRASGVGPEWFYAPCNRTIFAVVAEMVGMGLAVDARILGVELESRGELEAVGGALYLMELSSHVETTAHFDFFVGKLADGYALRRFRGWVRELGQMGGEHQTYEALRPLAEPVLTSVNQLALRENGESQAERIDVVVDRFKALFEGRRVFSNELRTGLRLWDRRYGPIDVKQWEHYLVVIAAGPSVGKSSWARQIVYKGLTEGKRFAVFLLETSWQVWLSYMVSQQAKVNLREFEEERSKRPDLAKEIAPHLKDLKERYAGKRLFVYDDHYTIEEIESRAKLVASQIGGLDGVVIDYIQLARSSGSHNTREQEVAEVSRRCKMLGKSLNCSVFALSQLSREGRKEDNPPQLTDLRESGAIEQDADLVVAIHRPKFYITNKKDPKTKETILDRTGKPERVKKENLDTAETQIVELYTLKNRNGPCGHDRYFFQRKFTLFEDMPNVDKDGNISWSRKDE